ncbi:hypothetical protein [Cystobacter ferrugineus]|uniref:Uncharacterized protein n=1 Tax=Cystobacter ferrugineus TaxID=83449 RepID=A0A1L9B3B3_9BACT|nr:hypothetical protein [Cystobacter ferrugineus]OJH36716.1 hypothetical protein BON30_33390 [Cystobacter ferrugineus]
MRGSEMSRVGELVLVWLLTRADGKGARSAVSSALKPFTAHRWSPGEWSTQLDAALGSLEAAGLIEQTARKGLGLTKEGRARALEFLGEPRLPKGLTWKKLRLTWLTARALELPNSQGEKLGAAGHLRAVLVQKQLGLERVGARTLKQVQDELCWKQLGVTTDKPFTLAAVQSLLLGRVLQSSREVKASQALEQLAARKVGARRTDAESLRLAALQSWLLPASSPTPQATATSTPERAPEPVPAPEPRSADETLPAFAERVLSTARAATSGRFGEDRVFISHVWRALGDSSLDERTFKNRLIEANQKRLLSLSRADMVNLMDPADVSASETRYLGATFHFIAL